MNRIYVLIGPARAGKSTYSKQWQRDHCNGVVICGDDIRKALHGCRYSSNAEGMVFAIKDVMMRALYARGHDILCDGTHTTLDSIIPILRIDPQAIPIPILTDANTCIERAILTDQPDLVPVIKRHADQVQDILNLYDSYENLFDVLRQQVKTNSVVVK